MKTLFTSSFLLIALILAGCASDAPMTEEEQAAMYGITVQEFREEKRAAARMNMSIEEHMNMLEEGHEM